MPPLDAGDEVGRTAIAFWMGAVGRADAARGISAKGDDMADADVAIAADNLIDLPARRADTGEMRSGTKLGLRQDARDGRMGALASRAAGAVCHRDKARIKGREAGNGAPKIVLHLLGFGRKELERDRGSFLRAKVIMNRGGSVCHDS